MCGEHNGWTNYQTWVSSLWLDERQFRPTIEVYIPSLIKGNTEAEAKVKISQFIENLFDEGNPTTDVASLYMDLMGHALKSINYNELADRLYEEFSL